ncbi:putative mon2, dimerization and cyclophilin-binding domain-containing protein [Rosa chinensis]|uniref:Putative mon2, dimerization and cyclophilin-binding domain-containing protein n=1 Tax=Rosa chinensis TaxID=74649 RepID=A0A2P6PIG9_ROSCH|nr:putative mon2, dimerization and cyclophilin-binding domain-containing protein [Rosa chinensis]
MDLLVLKMLLSVVASISLQIHSDCLLQIVRTCYNIYLGSKNILNKTKGERSVLSLFRFHLHCPVRMLRKWRQRTMSNWLRSSRVLLFLRS